MKYLSPMHDRRLLSRIVNLKKDPPFIIFQAIVDRATLRIIQIRRFSLLVHNGIREIKSPRGPGEVRKGTPDDIDQMARFENKKSLFEKRFAANEHCLIASINGAIVGYEWFTDAAFHIEERYRYRITIPADTVYAYDAYIMPEYRMCGFWPKFKKGMSAVMKELGRSRIITLIDYENTVSINTHLRFGFMPLKNILVIRILGKSFFRENSRLRPGGRLTHA